MHGIEVFQLRVNDLLKVGFGVCSAHIIKFKFSELWFLNS